MLRLINFLITGDSHLHEWETVERVEEKYNAKVIVIKYVLRCKHCGNVKTVDVA